MDAPHLGRIARVLMIVRCEMIVSHKYWRNDLHYIKNYDTIKTEQQCISVSTKGMTSRHLFTHIDRIRGTSPTKAFLESFCLTDLFRSA